MGQRRRGSKNVVRAAGARVSGHCAHGARPGHHRRRHHHRAAHLPPHRRLPELPHRRHAAAAALLLHRCVCLRAAALQPCGAAMAAHTLPCSNCHGLATAYVLARSGRPLDYKETCAWRAALHLQGSACLQLCTVRPGRRACQTSSGMSPGRSHAHRELHCINCSAMQALVNPPGVFARARGSGPATSSCRC